MSVPLPNILINIMLNWFVTLCSPYFKSNEEHIVSVNFIEKKHAIPAKFDESLRVWTKCNFHVLE